MKTDTEILENANCLLRKLKKITQLIDALWGESEIDIHKKVNRILLATIALREETPLLETIKFKSWESDLVKIKERIQEIIRNAEQDLERDREASNIFLGVDTLRITDTGHTIFHEILAELCLKVESWKIIEEQRG